MIQGNEGMIHGNKGVNTMSPKLLLRQNKLKIWLYRFQNKTISMPWTNTCYLLHQECLDCDVTDGSQLMIFLEKKTLTHKN